MFKDIVVFIANTVFLIIIFNCLGYFPVAQQIDLKLDLFYSKKLCSKKCCRRKTAVLMIRNRVFPVYHSVGDTYTERWMRIASVDLVLAE